MKKVTKLAISAAFMILVMTGCGFHQAETENGAADSDSETAEEVEAVEDTETSDDLSDSDESKEEATESEEECDEANEANAETGENKEKGHFTFKPVVIASIFRDIMGEDMCEAYGNYVEAALKGETEFAVKSEEAYDWMIGQFPVVCFPVLQEYTESDYGGAYHDGKATFHFTIPQSEFAEKEAEFEDIVTGILNENLRDDYSDLEKVLALYEYFCREYSYDFETYAEMSDRYIEELSAYRFLTTDHGVCAECAPAFSYLLLQAGVDATTASGICPENGEGHVWSYVTINGKNYHVDPTYGMGTNVCLDYFMMTDEQRENEDGYKKDEMCVGCHYKDEHNGDQYDAEDDFFAPLWEGCLTSWDPEKNLIYYTDKDGNDAVFDYSAFE
ncbi:MAG: transglutaminase-like domain-containing protein [Lachnospiraceae bacterium]|nr:transglutaminase-like domain-containing protein [Lachnospiraceae bacterium]